MGTKTFLKLLLCMLLIFQKTLFPYKIACKSLKAESTYLVELWVDQNIQIQLQKEFGLIVILDLLQFWPPSHKLGLGTSIKDIQS